MPETAEFDETIATGQAEFPRPILASLAGSLDRTIAPEGGAGLHARTRAAMARLARVDLLDVDIDADATTLRPSSLFRLAAPTEADTETAQYVLGKLLGRGGMGEVREAVQTSLGRAVAVKRLRQRSTPQNQAETALETGVSVDALKLVHESWVTGLLEHPNIVPIHDIALNADGEPLIVLKRIEGQSWDALMDDPEAIARQFGASDPLEWNLRILMQVCNAVHFAHSRGIIHRDIKPENVMVGGFGEVYVLDWGIAVSVDHDFDGRIPLAKDAHEVAGTPMYMAPEMIPGAAPHGLGKHTDIYLLGSTLFRLLAGHPPHAGGSAREVLAKVTRSTPEIAGENVPEQLADICRRALDYDPKNRPASAQALRLELQNFLQSRGRQQILDTAQASLLQLQALCERADGGEPDEVRGLVYSTHGECRFGFRTALAREPQNTLAQAGLRQADVALAEFELRHGDLRTASTLIEAIVDPPTGLTDELRTRSEQLATARSQALELISLRRDLDPGTGRRTRSLLIVAVGLAFTVAPLFRAASPTADNRTVALLWPVASFVLVSVLLLLTRKAMLQTAINRRFAGALVLTLFAQIVLQIIGAALDLSPTQLQVLLFFLWFSVASMLALSVSKRLVPACLGYLAALVVSAYQPELRFWLMSAAHCGLTINCLVLWLHPQPAAARTAAS